MNIINYQSSILPHEHCEFFCVDDDTINKELEKIDFKALVENKKIREMEILNYFIYLENCVEEDYIVITFEAKFDNSAISIIRNMVDNDVSFSWLKNYTPSNNHGEQLEKLRNEVMPELINKFIQLALD